MLVGATDIGGDHAQDDAVFNLAATGVLHFRIVDFLHFDLTVAEIYDTTIVRHVSHLYSFVVMKKQEAI